MGFIMLPIVCALYVTKFVPDGGFQAGLIMFLAIWIALDGVLDIAREE
jgi:multisubunit Na+/H+ antiporter MnhB subunit